MKCKYITYKNRAHGEQILIFGINTPHASVADAIGRKNVLSAGFIEINPGVPHGRSVSLGISSRSEADDNLIGILTKVGERFS